MRAVDQAYQTVRDGIIAGRYPPSTRITEQDIAAAAGVSRTPVREALRRLHSEGLVEFQANHGAVVTEWSAEDADEVFELRAMLEAFGAARAATRASEAQVQELRALAEEQYACSVAREGEYLERIGELNSRFHRRLQDAAGSPRLSRALSALLEAPMIMKTFLKYRPEDLERSAVHHLELVKAIEARDADWAASVMRSHILAARGALRR